MKARLVVFLIVGILVVAWVKIAPRLMQSTPAPRSETAQPAPRPVPDFTLSDQRGEPVTRASLLGKVWVADFIFSSCPGACLEMTKRMSEIDRILPPGDNVRLVTFSIDPRNDTPAALAAYAKTNAAGPRWLFLTGERPVTARVANDGFLFPLSTDPADFAHSRPPHSPTPVPALTVSGAAGAKANSLQSLAGATIRSKAISADESSQFK
jgi:protein SCO1/2